MGIIVLAYWVTIDGQPLMDFKKMANLGMSWEMFIIFAMVLPFAAIFSSESTGISAFIIETLSPMLIGKPTAIFIVLIIVLPTIITNFANNLVVGIAFLPILLSIGTGMGLNIDAMFVTLTFAVNLAFVTPAASPGAAILFANTDWLRPKDIYKYASIYIIVAVIFLLTLGLLWASLIF